MSEIKSRRYWIVKHGYDALRALPNYIWRTGEAVEPLVFRKVSVGDRWIGFAYTTSDARERPLSSVTGFYECIERSRYRPLPKKALNIPNVGHNAWMIRGEKVGWQAGMPVGVPSINELLGRSTYNQSTLIEIRRHEFCQIRAEVKRRKLDPVKIPVIRREPRNEQEVLAIIAGCYKDLGIEELLRIRTAFPDMTVKLQGKADPVHLELELYSKSFISHGHGNQVDQQGWFKEINEGKLKKRPVAVLCWIDDVQQAQLKRDGRVSRVFELQSLIREKLRIRW